MSKEIEEFRIKFNMNNDIDKKLYLYLVNLRKAEKTTFNKLYKRILLNYISRESPDLFTQIISQVLRTLDQFYMMTLNKKLSKYPQVPKEPTLTIERS